jgi:hypothetical protein
LPLPAGAATEATLALVKAKTDNLDVALSTRAVTGLTDAQLRASAVPVSAASLPLPSGAATEATLAGVATQSTLNSLLTAFNAEDFATQTTLLAADGRLTTIDAVLDSIKDTDGIKKITDALPTGANQIGAVSQGTKGSGSNAWPVAIYDASGNPVTITNDAGTYRLNIIGKVAITGATPPPATTPAVITAATPLVVGTHDTTFTIPNTKTFYLQEIVTGNEDPAKGSSVEVIFNNGTEHLIARVYTASTTLVVGYPDVAAARDGTALLGNGTNTIIVRRKKYTGSDIAIDTIVRGYTL